MCCFAGAVERVSNTRIFARLEGAAQILVYSMSVETRSENAMILPIPVAPGSGEGAVSFVNLEGYPAFFDDMEALFPRALGEKEFLSFAAAGPTLEVRSVGAFEASYVPSIPDFKRLDARFRLPSGVWGRISQYRDYGFAVFQLKAGRQEVHPMAFRFPTRHPGTLFFPTVHIHDGTVHEKADFDHALYAQAPEGLNWSRSEVPAGERMMTAAGSGAGDRTRGLVRGDLRVFQNVLKGSLPNRDTWVTPPGS